jgi:hypothetical protein
MDHKEVVALDQATKDKKNRTTQLVKAKINRILIP